MSQDVARALCSRVFALLMAAVIASPAQASAAGDGSARYTRASWTVQDGLPSPVVTAIAQDRDGYLWLGSFAGLIRFDGVQFVPWSALGGPPLPETVVHALSASRDGSIWIGFGNRGGVGRLENGALRVYGRAEGLPEVTVVALAEDREGTIWAGGLSGLMTFRDERWQAVGPEHGLAEGTTIDALYVDAGGALYAASPRGVFRRQTNGRFEFLAPSSSGVLDVVTDRSGDLWATGLRQGVMSLAASGRLTAPKTFDAVNGSRLLRDRQNRLWVATQGQGLIHVLADRWTGQSPIARFTTQQGLTNNYVRSLFEDREGNVWVGTIGGLDRFTPREADPILSVAPFSDGTVQTIATDADGNVWVGTTNGLARLTDGRLDRYDQRDALPSTAIRAMHVDTTGNLWIATASGPAVRPPHGRFSRVAMGAAPLARVTAITMDLQGGLWLCGFDGVVRWKGGALTNVPITGVPTGSAPSAAYTDRSGRVWIGFTGGGLVVHDNGKLTSYSEAEGLTRDTVIAIHEDQAGTMWIGTHHAISKFSGGRFRTLRQPSGLPGNRLMAIVGDESGHLWLGMDIGFVRIRADEFDKAASNASYRIPYRAVDVADGVDGLPATRGYPNVARLEDGTLAFITTSGVALVRPTGLKDSPSPPPPIIERVIADDEGHGPVEVDLPARTKRIEMDYTSLTLSHASRLEFRYMLEGNDTQWLYAGRRRQAFYTNLPPAQYRFRVAARIGDGAWVEAQRPWEFSIAPAFHQTAWFYLICGAALAGSAWTAWRYRLRQVKREYTLVIAERARMAREIHDTLLQGMAGVALQLHSVSQAMEVVPVVAKERCERARDSLEHYMREARYAIWNLRSPVVDGNDVAGALRANIEEITAGSGLTCSVRVTGTHFRCPPAVVGQMLRISREAIRNVVRHAGATHLRVDLTYDAPNIAMRIADDGCGFDPSALARNKTVHYGLEGMREQAKLAGGTLRLTTAPGVGTQVEVVVRTEGQSGATRWAAQTDHDATSSETVRS